MAKQKVALECLSYHAAASCEDTEKLNKDEIPSANTFNLFRYDERGEHLNTVPRSKYVETVA